MYHIFKYGRTLQRALYVLVPFMMKVRTASWMDIDEPYNLGAPKFVFLALQKIENFMSRGHTYVYARHFHT
jgi:hypothetical protein